MTELGSRYGYFDEDGDFIITNPKTPMPWTQILTNGRYGTVISQAGSGYSYYIDAEQSMISRWIQDLVKDDCGKYLYIKNIDTGDVRTVTFKPLMRNGVYSAKFSPGTASFRSVFDDYRCELSIFVPFQYDCEVASLTVENTSKKLLKLSLYSFLELNMGTSTDTHREFHKLFFDTEYCEKLNALITRKHLWTAGTNHWNDSYPWVVFHAASEKPSGYDSDKCSFLGMYADLKMPTAIAKGNCSQTSGKHIDAINALKLDLCINPGQSKTLSFFTGVASSATEVGEQIGKLASSDVNALLKHTKDEWKELLSRFNASLPDEDADMEALLNKWLPYQAIAGRLYARTGYYQLGGAYGYRDQLQDSLAALWLKPDITREQILLHASHQKSDGTVHHWWLPLSGMTPAERWSDDLLWLPFAVSEYLTFTGDKGILDTVVSYADEGEATIKEHCLLSITSVLSTLSPRGIPLILDGDWNDGLNALGRGRQGESFWMSEFLYHVVNRVLQTFDLTAEERHSLQKRALGVKDAFNAFAWNGYWFDRATDDHGKTLGGVGDNRIFLNPQNWAAISGISDTDRIAKAMAAVKRELISDYGPLLFKPPLTEPDSRIGYLSRYSPGSRENGGVYTHAAVWTMTAGAKLNDAALVDKVFDTLSPVRRSIADPDLYRAEPYVLPGNSDGPLSSAPGRAGWTWYTGSASWLYKSLIECLIGIKPREDFIRIQPCSLRSWKSAAVRFALRRGHYILKIRNPYGKPLNSNFILRLDGENRPDKTVPYLDDEHIIELIYS